MNTNHLESSKQRLTWLHISDAHLPPSSVDTYESDKVLKALIKTLKEEAAKGCLPDVLFFTGDLAEKGKDYTNAEKFFDDLLDATGLTDRFQDQAKQRLFVVPGNHDVDRDKTKYLKRTLDTSGDCNGFFSPESVQFREPYFARFHAYQEFFNRYFAGIRQFTSKQHWYAEVLPLQIGDATLRLGVIGLNSAWFSQDDHDKEKLWIGERVCDAAFKSISDKGSCDLQIVLQHHPYSCLHPEDANTIKGMITEKANIWLYGHIHEDETEEVRDQHGEILRFQTGAACAGRNHPSRALWGTLDLTSNRVSIKPICYKDRPPRRWTLDTTLFPDPYTKEFDIRREIIENFKTSIDSAANVSADRINVLPGKGKRKEISEVNNKMYESFWKVLDKQLTIVLEVGESYTHPGELEVAKNFNGVLGLLNLIPVLKELDIDYTVENSLDRDLNKTGNLLLDGSYGGNEVTKQVVNHKEVKEKLIFRNVYSRDKYTRWIEEIKTKKKPYKTKYYKAEPMHPGGPPKRIAYDYGFLAKINNPFNPSKICLICSGNHGAGTCACMMFLSSPQLMGSLIKKVNMANFQAVIGIKLLEMYHFKTPELKAVAIL